MAARPPNRLRVKFTDGTETLLQSGVGYINVICNVTVGETALKVLTLDCDKNMCSHGFNMAYVKSWELDTFKEES